MFCLEELSARRFLESFLPRLNPKISTIETQYIVFEGKSDMDKRLERRVRGWLRQNTTFVVLRDQDSGDCTTIKTDLVNKCSTTCHDSLIRIACRELESWYLGDLSAVDAAIGSNNLAGQQNKAKFRTPDSIGSPAAELERMTKGAYQKVGGSREIGKHISVDPAQNSSHSFGVFVGGVQQVLQKLLGREGMA
ncbi:MAG: DUF4276 family protein [Pirellulaceae bacterium]